MKARLGWALPLLAVLALTALGGLGCETKEAGRPLAPTLTSTPAPVAIMTPVPKGPVLISLGVSSQELSRGQTFELKLEVKPESHGLSGGEVTLLFDSKAISVLDIWPGDLFGPNPLVGKKLVDNTTGTLKYALARVGPTTVPTPSGPFAIVTAQVLESAKAGPYEIQLFQVGLADEKFEGIRNVASENAVMRIR